MRCAYVRIATRLGPGSRVCAPAGFLPPFFLHLPPLSPVSLSRIRVARPHFFALSPLCRRFAHSARQRVTDARARAGETAGENPPARLPACPGVPMSNPFHSGREPWQLLFRNAALDFLFDND